jgi:hypothetical protein
VKSQLVPSQVGVLLAGIGQGEHPVPQLDVLLFDAHDPLQAWNPLLHEIAQLVPSHVELPFAPGAGQLVHRPPHESTLVFASQKSPHLCVPVGQTFPHGVPAGMQSPAHSVRPAGQDAVHAVPSHDTVPPLVGAAQGVHDAAPQLATSRSSTQRPPHT